MEITDTEHKSALDETLRNIGRNVLHFQRMEAMLKFLISRSRLEGEANDLRANHGKNVSAVSRQTMGNLVKAFIESVYSGPSDKEMRVLEDDQVWLSFAFKIKADRETVEQRQNALGKVVEERNFLIHQMLEQFDQTSTESCRKFSELLEAQAERIRPEYEALGNLIRTFQEGREKILVAMEKGLKTSVRTNHEL